MCISVPLNITSLNCAVLVIIYRKYLNEKLYKMDESNND